MAAARRSPSGKQRPGDLRPCDGCGASIFFAQRVSGVGKLTWRAFDAVPVTDDRRAVAHVLVGSQAWRRVDLLEHYLVSRELTDAKARELADTYPHHLLHTHPTDVQATLQADFKEAQRLSSGEVAFKYVETVQAQAGQAGEFEVPTSFTIAMSPFEGGDPVEVEAKFRYRLRAGELKVSYALTRPHDIQRQAYLDLVQAVADGIPHPVFRGRPA